MTAELDAVQAAAASLLAQAGPTVPALLRVRAGTVSVELRWGVAAPVTGSLATSAQPPPAGQPATVAATPDVIGAPTVGVFYRSPEPGAPPFVAEGDTVSAGQQVGIVEAMKLMVPIEADRAGTIARVLAADGASVEYDDPLFEYAPGEG